MNMFETEDAFDKKIEENWKQPVIYDGITELKTYKDSNPKILWVLKETNENGNTKPRDHRDFHRNVTEYNNWKRTYKKIILTSYGLLNNQKYSDLLEIANDKNLKEKYEILYNVAFINVNKTGASSQTDNWLLKKSYNELNHKSLLLEQIEGIAPEIIINCSRVDDLFYDVAARFKLEPKIYTSIDNYKINYASNKKQLIIDYWHPNARIKEEWYCTQIFEIYNCWKHNILK